MQANFIEGLVKYPDDLPCPQVDTDLVPRERRYISDITEVRNMRMFQQEFQATRNRISFIFTEEEVREFREWYENEIIFGGAWFYADWPTLHKDKKIVHRFVGQPKYEWLFGGNPGMMGRSSAGVKYGQAPMAVTMYKVTATVELYDPRKVGKTANVYTSKIYPLYFSDDITSAHVSIEDGSIPPKYRWNDGISSHTIITEVTKSGYIYSNYIFADDISSHTIIDSVTMKRWIYSNYAFSDDISSSHTVILSGEITQKRIGYDKMIDDITSSHSIILSGEIL